MIKSSQGAVQRSLRADLPTTDTQTGQTVTEDNFHDQDQVRPGTAIDLHYFTGDSTSMITVLVDRWGERGLHVTDLMGRLQWFPYSSIQRLVVDRTN